MNKNANAIPPRPPADNAAWKEIVAKYQKSSAWRASWQIINTIVPYGLLWYLMYVCLPVSWWLVVPLAILAGGFLVRVFIIFHDCGHGSFFKSRGANDAVGFLSGVLTFTPYYHWRWEHAIHHSSSGDLDRRGTGDVWTMTVQEYLESSRWKKFAYRLARNPVRAVRRRAVVFVCRPAAFSVAQGQPAGAAFRSCDERGHPRHGRRVELVFGVKAYVLIQLIIIMVAGGAGVWMFYVQHQFEDVYWERGEDGAYVAAALEGSSFYKLPRILQWFSGNIGFHHIHHLSPRIPNYNLEKCHQADPLFQTVKPITLFSSFKSVTFRLWDEKNKRLVGYRHLRELRKQQKQAAR